MSIKFQEVVEVQQYFSDIWYEKMFRMDYTIKVSVLDEEPQRMGPKSEVYFNFIEQYILYVRDCEAG